MFTPLAGHLDHRLERRLGVGNDAVVGAKDTADLGRLDIDMHEGAAFGVGLEIAGVTVGPAIADAHHEVRLEQGRVAVTMGSLKPHHARHQRVIVRYHAPAHQGRDHRHPEQLGQGLKFAGGVGVDDAPTRHQQGPIGLVEHAQGLFALGTTGPRLVGHQGFVGVRIELDFGHLDVDGQIDQHRPRTRGTHDLEGLLEGVGHLGRLPHGDRPLGHGPGDGLNIHRLEVFLVQLADRSLAGDAEDRYGVGAGGVEPGDHVGPGGARGADADPDITGLGAGKALGHVGGTLDMARQHMIDAAEASHRRIERVDRGPGHAEGHLDAFLDKHVNSGVGSSHASHDASPQLSIIVYIFALQHYTKLCFWNFFPLFLAATREARKLFWKFFPFK